MIKKLITTIIISIIFIPIALGQTIENEDDEPEFITTKRAETIAYNIGHRILKANHINRHLVFTVSKKMSFYYKQLKNGVVQIYKPLFKKVETEDEIAAIISINISNIISSTFKRKSIFNAKANYETDIETIYEAMELMEKAGYDPNGMLLMYQKDLSKYAGAKNLIYFLNEYSTKQFPKYKNSSVRQKFEAQYLTLDYKPSIELNLNPAPIELFRFLTPEI